MVDADGKVITALDIIRLIILKEFEGDDEPLAESQVMLYNEKWKIPADNGIFISIGILGLPKVFNNSNRIENRPGDGFYEIKRSNSQELITIDIMSRSLAALERKETILAALASQYAQELQEKYSFQIARIPIDFKDVSDLEATALLYRFQIVVPVLTWSTREKQVPYYDHFEGKINTEDTEVEFVQKTEE